MRETGRRQAWDEAVDFLVNNVHFTRKLEAGKKLPLGDWHGQKMEFLK